MKAISTGCKDIQLINIFGCKEVTDEGLKALSEGCNGIKFMKLGECRVTQKGVEYLMQRFKGIDVAREEAKLR